MLRRARGVLVAAPAAPRERVRSSPRFEPGTFTDLRNQYGLLRTLEDGYGISSHPANAATADVISVWK